MKDQIIYLNKLRKEALKHMVIITICSITFAIALTLLISSNINSTKLALYLLLFLGFGSFFLLSKLTGLNRKVNEYTAYYKKILVEEPFRNAFGQVFYDFNRGFEKKCRRL